MIRWFFKRQEKRHGYHLSYSYSQERQSLNTLVSKLFTKNHERFENEEEIMEMFEKAMLSGNILPIGRLIDTTFEKGTFRKIGELGEDTKGLSEFVDSL